MSKKKKERTRDKRKETRGRKKAEETRERMDTTPGGFDYGGIPMRNLKKNLGC